MNRQTFQTRKVLLISESQRDAHIRVVMNAPLDAQHPLEALIREEQKKRKPDQNSLMWAGPLADIERQAWVDGQRFSAESWHEQFKRDFLPEDDDPNIEKLVKDGYHKWTCTPSGDRVLVGSTTQLTVRGFSIYLEKVMAVGAQMGVMFGMREEIAA